MRSILSALLFTFLMLGSALAREIKVGDISSNYDSNKTKFFLELNDDDSIDAIRFLQTTPSGQINLDETHPAERVIAEGAVIYWNGNYEVVRLRVENFNVKTGGVAKLDYLVNGLTGSRRFVSLMLQKKGNGFELTYGGKPVNKFFVEANRNAFGMIIGIKGIYPTFE